MDSSNIWEVASSCSFVLVSSRMSAGSATASLCYACSQEARLEREPSAQALCTKWTRLTVSNGCQSHDTTSTLTSVNAFSPSAFRLVTVNKQWKDMKYYNIFSSGTCPWCVFYRVSVHVSNSTCVSFKRDAPLCTTTIVPLCLHSTHRLKMWEWATFIGS